LSVKESADLSLDKPVNGV